MTTQRKHTQAHSVAQTIFALHQGIYAYEVIRQVAGSADASGEIPDEVSLERVQGYEPKYRASIFAKVGREHPLISDALERAMAAGTILEAHERLRSGGYFNNAPNIELIFHLRNAIAHGGRFNFDANGKKRLKQHVAHHAPPYHSDENAFHVSESLQGTEVFEYVKPGDIAEILRIAAQGLMLLDAVDGGGFEEPTDLKADEFVVHASYGRLLSVFRSDRPSNPGSPVVDYVVFDAEENFRITQAGSIPKTSMVATQYVVRRDGIGYKTVRRLTKRRNTSRAAP